MHFEKVLTILTLGFTTLSVQASPSVSASNKLTNI